MKDGAMSLQEARHTDNEGAGDSPNPLQTVEEQVSDDDLSDSQNMQTEQPFQNMQEELHSKGAVLTRAWSDLFSFITKYQAELTVKENTINIAEKEIDVRKRQLEEMKPVVEAGSDEISRLQEEIHSNQRLLNKTQSELSVREQMLRRVQSDLNCNMELLEKSRSELRNKQSEVIHYRGNLERLKSELTVKEEQIQIKDNLLKKLQNQLMKENAELKEQLEIKERTLEMERRSHELTKRSLRQSKSKSSTSTPQAVIEIPDSPPTLDLSVEQADFGLSNIISMAESQSKEVQPMEQDIGSSFRVSETRISSLTTDSFLDQSSRLTSQGTSSMSSTPTKEQWSVVSPSAPSQVQKYYESNLTPTSAPDSQSHDTSDTFFPLSVSQSEDSKSGIDTSAMFTDRGHDLGAMPGTPSSGTSDSNQGPPVPISGPIPSAGMSPGKAPNFGGDGKSVIAYPDGCKPKVRVSYPGLEGGNPNRCPICNFQTAGNLTRHMRRHTGERPHKCPLCHLAFVQRSCLTRHIRTHTGEKPYSCSICDKKFTQKGTLNCHMLTHQQL